MFKELYRIFFKQGTNYPPQVIPEKALAIIELLDEHFNGTSMHMQDTELSLITFSVELRSQFKSPLGIMNVVKHTTDMLEYYYIPRSVAFVIDQSGTWHFIVGVRRTNDAASDVTATLWLDALARTNNARTQ